MIWGTISKYVSRPIVSAEAESTVIDALKLMSARRISCLVVLAQQEPVGILTERDVVFAANWVLGQPDLRVREVMSKPVLTAGEDLSIKKACRLLCENSIRHLVVVNRRLEMCGVFTQTDLVRALDKVIFKGIEDVSVLMSSHVWQAPPHISARHALALMASHAISGIVIVDNGRPLGIFTERDVVRLIAAGVDLATLPVREAMSAPVISVPLATAPHAAIKRMQANSVRRLVVTNGGDEMVGILTQTDFSRALDHHSEAFLHELVGKTPSATAGDCISMN